MPARIIRTRYGKCHISIMEQTRTSKGLYKFISVHDSLQSKVHVRELFYNRFMAEKSDEELLELAKTSAKASSKIMQIFSFLLVATIASVVASIFLMSFNIMPMWLALVTMVVAPVGLFFAIAMYLSVQKTKLVHKYADQYFEKHDLTTQKKDLEEITEMIDFIEKVYPEESEFILGAYTDKKDRILARIKEIEGN